MDSKRLDRVTIIPINSVHKELQNALVPRRKSPDDAWITFIECYLKIYKSFPTQFCLGQESDFASKAFRSYATVYGIYL